MAYEKQTWISYDDNKTEEQNIQDGAVVTAERMNHIEQGLVEHEKDKENPHEVTAHQVGALTAEESSANVIYQLIGKEKARITLILDFKDKIVGSVIENPNLAFYGTLNGIPTAAVGGNEEPQSGYDNLSILDGKYRGGANTGANTVRFSKQVFDILESVKGALGEKFFSDQGAYDDKSKVVLIRSLITRMIYRNYGFGSGPNGQKITTQVYANVSKTWSVTTSNITNEVREMSKEIPKSNFNEFISEDGKTTIISFAEPSDNITASAAYLDYSRLEIEIELSANEVVESIVATYYGKNIGNVDNYGTATQAEAEAGTATDKFMTPLRTKQHVSSRIASQTEAESGTATEKLMTPLRTKQHVDKRIATKAEAEAGTSETAIMTPKATKQAIEKIAANTSIARKSFTGVSTIETSERGKFNPDGAIISFKRTGNLVLFNAKLNHTGGMKWVTNIMSTGIPIGYRADKGFYETQFALPLNIEPPKQTGTTLKWSRYTIDDDNIFIYSDNTGNHFISGEWLTIDPFPEEDIV